MKYAVHYYKSFRYFNQIDEVVLDYKGTEYLTEFVPSFLKPEQRAVINIAGLDIEDIFEYLLVLKQKHENFVVQLNWFTQLDWIPALEEMNIQYMFLNLAVDFDQVYAFSQYNISDIYICEGLGFKLKDLQPLRDRGILIRVFPDVAQYNSNFPISDINKFFIRPEGLDAYEDYIDVIELWRCDDRLSVVYEIYKQRQWSGYLEDVVVGFSDNFSVNNLAILPLFDEMRVGCGRTCLVNGNCHYCFRCLTLSPMLEENDLLIVRKKDPILSEEEQEKLRKYVEELKGKENESNQDDMLFEN